MVLELKETLEPKKLDELRSIAFTWGRNQFRWLLRYQPELLLLWRNMQAWPSDPIDLRQRNEIHGGQPRETPSRTELNPLYHQEGGDQRRSLQPLQDLALAVCQPALEALLENYGASLVVDVDAQELSRELGIDVDISDALPMQPIRPGGTWLPPRVAWVFTLDDWPGTKHIDPFVEIDPRTRNMMCIGSLEEAGLESAVDGIPEEDIEADYDGAMAHVAGAIFDLVTPAFHHLAVEDATVEFAVHASASRSQVELFYREQGVRVLSLPEGMRMQRVEDGARCSHIPAGNTEHLETFPYELFGSAQNDELGAYRQFLKDTIPWGALGTQSLEDRLDTFIRQAVAHGASELDVYAEAFFHVARFSLESRVWWQLASVLTKRQNVQLALRERGFDRNALWKFWRRFQLVASRRGVRPAPPELNLPSIALPSDTHPAIATWLRTTFPYVTDSLVVAISELRIDSERTLHADVEVLLSNADILTEEDRWFTDIRPYRSSISVSLGDADNEVTAAHLADRFERFLALDENEQKVASRLNPFEVGRPLPKSILEELNGASRSWGGPCPVRVDVSLGCLGADLNQALAHVTRVPDDDHLPPSRVLAIPDLRAYEQADAASRKRIIAASIDAEFLQWVSPLRLSGCPETAFLLAESSAADRPHYVCESPEDSRAIAPGIYGNRTSLRWIAHSLLFEGFESAGGMLFRLDAPALSVSYWVNVLPAPVLGFKKFTKSNRKKRSDFLPLHDVPERAYSEGIALVRRCYHPKERHHKRLWKKPTYWPTGPDSIED